MPLTFPSSPADGATHTDDYGRPWVFRLTEAYDAEYTPVGVWKRVAEGTVRKTAYAATNSPYVISIPEAIDFTFYFVGTGSLRVNLETPTIEGQTLVIKIANGTTLTIYLGIYVMMTEITFPGDVICYQAISINSVLQWTRI